MLLVSRLSKSVERLKLRNNGLDAPFAAFAPRRDTMSADVMQGTQLTPVFYCVTNGTLKKTTKRDIKEC